MLDKLGFVNYYFLKERFAKNLRESIKKQKDSDLYKSFKKAFGEKEQRILVLFLMNKSIYSISLNCGIEEIKIMDILDQMLEYLKVDNDGNMQYAGI